MLDLFMTIAADVCKKLLEFLLPWLIKFFRHFYMSDTPVVSPWAKIITTFYVLFGKVWPINISEHAHTSIHKFGYISNSACLNSSRYRLYYSQLWIHVKNMYVAYVCSTYTYYLKKTPRLYWSYLALPVKFHLGWLFASQNRQHVDPFNTWV